MLFNEKYGISHINFNAGWIIIDSSYDMYEDEENAAFHGLVRGFSKLIDDEIESLGMMQYKIRNAPFDFIFQFDNTHGIVIVAENMKHIDKLVNYIKNSLYDINYNMLYEKTEFF